MRNLFNKFKDYSFWVSFSAAVIILLNAFGRAFGFSVANQVVDDCIMAVAGILLLFGIVTMSDSKEDDENDEDENSDDEGEDK